MFRFDLSVYIKIKNRVGSWSERYYYDTFKFLFFYVLCVRKEQTTFILPNLN